MLTYHDSVTVFFYGMLLSGAVYSMEWSFGAELWSRVLEWSGVNFWSGKILITPAVSVY